MVLVPGIGPQTATPATRAAAIKKMPTLTT
jgi:hypothetical protein